MIQRVFAKQAASALLAACFLAWVPVGAIAQSEPYRLAPGDKVRAYVTGLGNRVYVATVNASGDVRLPFLGRFEASGLTLDELTQDITLAAAGRQIRQVEGSTNSYIVLGEDDIFLDIEEYRPVTVTGAVAAPGRVAYDPGMTARMAVGAVGGAAIPGLFDRSTQLANFRTRQAELGETEAWLMGDLWRIETLLSDAAPDALADTLGARLSQDERALVRERIENARAALARERDDIDARIALTRQRIDFLTTALGQFQTASDIEEQRLQDVLSLSDRGLTTANALDNARQGALNASSRLLTTQADLAETERELQSLALQKRGLQEDFEAGLLEERARVERTLAEIRARASGLGAELALGALRTEEDAQNDTGPLLLLHRQEDGAEVSREIAPSAALQPGDVLEVLIGTE